jgi:hypothetical protein
VGAVDAGPCTDEVVHVGVESSGEAENLGGTLEVELPYLDSKLAAASYEADNWPVSVDVVEPPEMEGAKVSSFVPSQWVCLQR